jgi:inhibitor of cysteine peptidase
LNERDCRRKVAVRVGQEFELRLPENPTAGYRWRLVESGGPVCSLAGDVFEPGGKPGQAGVRCWRFRIMAAGSTRVGLVYRRNWEAPAVAPRQFVIELAVTPAGWSRNRRRDPHR